MIGLVFSVLIQMVPVQPAPQPQEITTWRAVISHCRGEACATYASRELYNTARECTLILASGTQNIIAADQDPTMHITSACIRQSQADFDRSMGRTAV